MNKTHLVRYSALAAAVASAMIGMTPAYAQTPPPEPDPVVVVEERSLRERTDSRNLILETPLEVRDAAGAAILSLPVGTAIGRERVETRFAAEGVAIRQRTDLRDVMLQEPVSVTDRSTGSIVELPAGTIIRVKLDQRMDANGNILRDRIDLRAVKPDGTKVRIRDRAPEIEVVEVENEVDNDGIDNDGIDNRRQRGRDGATPQSARGGGVARVERSGREGRADRAERPDRSGRSDRVERPDRPDRSGRGGGNSGPG